MTNRRDFIKKTSLLGVGGLVGGSVSADVASVTPEMSAIKAVKKELGLQIYSLGKELYEDLPRRLKQLKDMGYIYLELCGYDQGKIRDIDMMEFKKIAEDNGLKITCSHVEPYIEGHRSPLLLDYKKEYLPQVLDYWKRAADDHAKIGCRFLIQATMPTIRSHERAYIVCDFINEAAKVVKQAGMQYAYHNHHMEFEHLVRPEDVCKNNDPWTIPGDQIYDIFLEKTDPAFVQFEMDVYWTIRGGNDPVEYMQKFADRIKVLHIKDTTILGQSGLLNFENIFNQMYANGIKDFFVEMEPLKNGATQYEGVKACADFLHNASYVK